MLGKNGENSFAYLFGVELRSEADDFIRLTCNYKCTEQLYVIIMIIRQYLELLYLISMIFFKFTIPDFETRHM